MKKLHGKVTPKVKQEDYNIILNRLISGNGIKKKKKKKFMVNTNMSFRTSDKLQRYELVRYVVDDVIRQPANDHSQNKNGYKFTITDRSALFDYYNGYFEVVMKLQKKADGTGYADDRTTIINGSHSLIKDMTITSSGKLLYHTSNVNRITNVKHLLEYSDDFSRSVCQKQFLVS